nr:aquaporin-8a.2 [Solea senegalensis]
MTVIYRTDISVEKLGMDDTGNTLMEKDRTWTESSPRPVNKYERVYQPCSPEGFGVQNLMTPAERYNNATGAAFDILTSEKQLYKAIFGEVAMTCLVTMVLLLVAVNGKTKTPHGPFLVGCSVIISVLAGADVSGACLNPARAFGPAVMINYWNYHWVYWAGPLGGGLVATALVRLILGDKKIRVIMKS